MLYLFPVHVISYSEHCSGGQGVIGLIDFTEGIHRGSKCRVRMEGTYVLGIPAVLAHIESPPRPKRRSLLRALDSCAGTLGVMRVGTVFFSGTFQYRDFFLDRGFHEGDCRELLRLKAARILALSAPSHERALVSAARGDRRVSRLLYEMGKNFRFLYVDVPYFDFAAFENAFGDMGLTPEPLRRDRMADVDAAVFLSSPRRPVFLSDRCRVLRVGEKTPLICGGREVERVSFTLPDTLRGSVPEGFPQPELLSAALESGRIDSNDVIVAKAE